MARGFVVAALVPRKSYGYSISPRRSLANQLQLVWGRQYYRKEHHSIRYMQGSFASRSIVLRDLSEHQQTEGSCAIYHFCDFSDRSHQTAITVIQILLRQVLLQGNKAQLLTLQKAWEASSKPPRLQDLSQAFLNVCSLQETMYLILDAVDEFEDRKNLFPFLHAAVQAGLKVFVTSRSIPDIEDAFVGNGQIEIKASCKDLRKFVENSLRGSELCNSISSIHTIVEAVVDHAGET
jgi:hypothetical protein